MDRFQSLLKRYFWVVGGLVVVACAVFAAKATGHLVAGQYLNDADHGPKVTPKIATTPAPTKTFHNKDGTQLATRDMFCSDCTPSIVETPTTDPSSIQITSLPLQLLSTSIGSDPKDSYATLINSENQHQGAFGVGDIVPGASNSGEVVAIHFKYIDFKNGGHTERLGLVGTTPPVVAVAEPPPPPPNGDDMQSALESGIKKIDDTHFEIDKSLVDKVLLNPMAVSKGARVVPSMKDGKPDGFKLYAIRPSSAFAKLGLTNGDTLNSINGFDLTSADKALEAYTKLKDATSLEVDVTRRGKPVSLNYTVK
ncbi:MAG TPA: type II secretion system protein GspC [Kofleriaceae bacterium]|jgi:general secretion pathway protein C